MDPLQFIFVIAILIMSVVIHEVSHGYAALWLGDPTAKLQGRLTLNPLKHLDLFGSLIIPVIFYTLGGFIIGWAKPVVYNPYNFNKFHRWGDAIVAAVGPLSNIVLAIVFSVLIRFSLISLSLPASFVKIAAFVVFINIVLALFNLIPIPPLDGSKILFTLLPDSFSNFKRILEQYSIIFILIFILFLWQWFVPVVFIVFNLLTGSPLAI